MTRQDYRDQFIQLSLFFTLLKNLSFLHKRAFVQGAAERLKAVPIYRVFLSSSG